MASREDDEEYQKWLDSFGNGKNEDIGSPSSGGAPIEFYKAGNLVLESVLGKPMTHKEDCKLWKTKNRIFRLDDKLPMERYAGGCRRNHEGA